MNRETIFVFKPLSTGLGLEHSHQLRNGPGRWSRPVRRSAQRALSLPKLSSAKKPAEAVAIGRSPLLFWQRCLALWCDGMVSLMLAFFVVMAAGLFASLIESGSVNPADWFSAMGSMEWIRQSAQMIVSLVNLASVMPWLPFVSLLVLFGVYRTSVVRLTGTSIGQWFVRWLVPETPTTVKNG